MDTKALEAATRTVVEAAAHDGSEQPHAEGDWGPRQLLAHLVAANRSIAQLTGVVLAGVEPGSFTNRPAVQRQYLDAIATAGGDWAGLVGTFEQSSRELGALVANLSDVPAATPIHTVLWDGDRLALETQLSLADLLGIINAHAEGHAQQLRELRKPA